MTPVDDYIVTTDPEIRTLFQHMREVAMQQIPNVTQGVSYAMPAFMYKGKPVLSFMVTKKHLSLYPFSGKVVDKLLSKLSKYELTTGSIHFSLQNPIPDTLLKDIIATRLLEIEARLSKH